MRRALPVAMLSALLAVAPAAVAQRGGSGGHGGGFHGGFAGGGGGFHGGFGGGRSFGAAPRFYGPSLNMVTRAPHYNMMLGSFPVYRPAYGARYGTDRRGWDHRGRYRTRYNGYGYGYGGYSYPYGYVNSWELLPWDFGDSDFDQEGTSASQPAVQAQPQEGPSESEYGPGYGPEYGAPSGYGEDYAPPPPYQAPAAPVTPVSPEPQLTLIFKDGHTEQIRNYVLSQDALVDMDEAGSGRMLRIPLANLNLPATEKAAQQAGLDFSPPAS